MTPEERFWPKVNRKDDDSCWEWTGWRSRNGYGRLRLTKHTEVAAHRFSYELLVGPIPEGLQIDHLCRNRSCVNPAHLEPVTCQENLLRGLTIAARNAAKTHCPRGHSYSGENLYRKPNGGRECRACMTARVQRWTQRQRAAS